MDEAFCFYYQDNLRLLERLGGELVYVSPIHDRSLPEQLDGLILGGGYPELYCEALSQNESMREAVKGAAEGGFLFWENAEDIFTFWRSWRRKMDGSGLWQAF